MSDSITETMRRCEALLNKHSGAATPPPLSRVGLSKQRVQELLGGGRRVQPPLSITNREAIMEKKIEWVPMRKNMVPDRRLKGADASLRTTPKMKGRCSIYVSGKTCKALGIKQRDRVSVAFARGGAAMKIEKAEDGFLAMAAKISSDVDRITLDVPLPEWLRGVSDVAYVLEGDILSAKEITRKGAAK
jgi:hypothetical protein